ncbi:MAG: ABC transporter permease subunit, partial [Chitinivibrionales bacterium]|nr:ABC transporter permease subunit [Chitinivibrionales bacterium]
MLLVLIRKELHRHLLTGRYLIVSVLVVVLVAAATVIRTGMYNKLQRDFHGDAHLRSQVMLENYRWEQSKTFGYTADSPPNPLAIFAAGLENEITRSYWLGWDDPLLGPRKLHAPSFQFHISFDLVTVVAVICSLLCLALVFDSVCAEREQGTLRVLMSGPVPRDTVMLAKIIAGWIVIALPLLMAWLVSLVYATAVGRVPFSADDAGRIAWMVVLSLLYAGFYLGVGLSASCWFRRSATAMAACLFCWVVLALAVPNV